MEIFVTLLVFLFCIAMNFIFIRIFLSGSLGSKGVLRFLFLFFIGGFLGGTILYLYSSFGIDTETFGKVGIAATAIFLFWVERKRAIHEADQDKPADRLSRILLYSASGLVVLPLVINLIIN
ncbi:hypothetical protein [Alkalihalobacterium chitinilyticum]|uniref:Uncharacterized protein n=1 Tax=Alkalihalobacterium chitinilyticum TaxID=2980103 RepID=A0ABT5VN20_9BACI|nr:hypothetical protein [Alkalihalobacterium chitinilyticum]MDE5416172.1 hypothetical protein [Alkalihalobacterium chitinilyticum]